jgi:hypothetical protein
LGGNFNPTGNPEIIGFRSNYSNGSSWSSIFGPAYGKNPSLSHSPQGGNGDIGIAWENNSKIYFKKTNASGTWSSTKQISQNLWYLYDQQKPSLSFTYGIAHIVWQGWNDITYTQEGFHRTYDVYSNTYGSISQLPHHGDEVANVSVSTMLAGNASQAQNYKAFYELPGSGEINMISHIDGQFEEINYGEGKYPNLVDKGMDRAIWTKYTSAPYFIMSDYVEKEEKEKLYSMQRLDFAFTPEENGGQDGYLTLELVDLSMDTSLLRLNEDLISENINIHAQNNPFVYGVKVYAQNLTAALAKDKALLKFNLEKDNQSIALNALKINQVINSDGSVKNEMSSHSANILGLPYGLAKLKVSFGEKTPEVTQILMSSDDISNFLAKEGITNSIESLPSEYSLQPNYPNPFNPVTTINFELPEDSDVQIAVYSSIGQKVGELVHSHLAAGRHVTHFNGSNLASGLYFCEMRAGNFQQVQKMLLVK